MKPPNRWPNRSVRPQRRTLLNCCKACGPSDSSIFLATFTDVLGMGLMLFLATALLL